MRALGYEIDEATGHSVCGTVFVGSPEDRLRAPSKWDDGLRGRWVVCVVLSRTFYSECRCTGHGKTLAEAEAEALGMVTTVSRRVAGVLKSSEGVNAKCPPYLCAAELRALERLRKWLTALREERRQAFYEPRTSRSKWIAADVRTEIATVRAIRAARSNRLESI